MTQPACTFDPTNGKRLDNPVDPNTFRPDQWPVPEWVFNPWVGTPRHPDDVKSDPYGYEIVVDEQTLLAARATTSGVAPARKHAHYFKPCPFKEVDVYRVLELFQVTDQALGHAIKKLLVAGGRGAGKDISQDVQEAADTLARWQEMRAEEQTLR